MLTRLEADYHPQITFTSDFHELVTGNLKAGVPLRLSYDPQRIVPIGEPYLFGDPQRPVTAHVRFSSSLPVQVVELTSPGGVSAAPDRDATGQGSMLKAELDIPADAEMVSVGFTFTCLDGTVVDDNDFGVNFNFRFPEHDLEVLDTNVVADAARNVSLFHVRVGTVATVEQATVRFGKVGEPHANNEELALHEVERSEGRQGKEWMVEGVVVPTGAVISFKVFYWIGGVRFKDDNTGHYYLSPPRPPEHVPPPPAELARAALAWK